MNAVFADSFYFFALLNRHDPSHGKAVAFTQTFLGQMVTTVWVLTELADGLARPCHRRPVFVQLLNDLKANPHIVVIPSTQHLLDEGIVLYEQRPDKEWTLTDCIPFVVMTERGIQEALTGDHHFEQTGFVALLK
jgi:predicted nucleic acid-binding protein